MGLIAKFKEHKARRKTVKEVLEGYHYTRPMPPVNPPKKSVEGETKRQSEIIEQILDKYVCAGCSGCCNCFENGKQKECSYYNDHLKWLVALFTGGVHETHII